jgi:glycosyltransferase involved in cell wall biosynthesis
MQKKSVLFLTNAYPDFDTSYRGVFIREMASSLQRDGYEISVVTPKIYKGSRFIEEQNGIKTYRFPFFSGNRLLIEYKEIPYLRMVLYYITGFLFTSYALIRHRCELIHVHWAIPTGLIGALTGALLGKPLIVTIHGSDFRLAMGRSLLLKKIFLYVCKKARHLHCVSGVMRKEIAGVGIDERKISTFPMGVDESFLGVGRDQRRNPNHQCFTILSNRNLLPIYNVSLLIRAIPIVLKGEPRVKFLIAGGGPERENLEREAKDLNVGDFVQFLGRIPHEKMPNLLAQADIYVSTSLHDGTSVSLLEALGSGAFPVVTDIPSNREWISDGENGFLVPTDEERVLAIRIIKAIRNRSLAEKARQKNLRLVTEKVLWPAIIEKIKRIYEKVLSSEI